MKSFAHQPEIIKQPAKQYSGSAVSFFMAYPSSALKEYIDFYYQAEVGVQEHDSSHLNVYSLLLPIDSVEMIFCYNDTTVRFNNEKKNSTSLCHIIGQHNLQSQCRVNSITKINKTFYIRFKPGGFSKLFGIRQNEIKNNFFAADDILNSHGRSLQNRINNSVSFDERVKVIESSFINKLLSNKNNNIAFPQCKLDNTHKAMHLIKKNRGRLHVYEIAKYLDIPERTMNWSFSNYIGLAPKEFISVSRFRNILSKLSGKKEIDWMELVQSCGYYDQPHLINDFKTVTGITPYLYLKSLGKTVMKCTNKLFFIEPGTNSTLTEYSGDLMKAESIAAL